MADYNLEEAFARIEEELTNDIINRIKSATPEDLQKKGSASVWKAKQLKELQDFKERNKSYFTKETKKDLYDKIEAALKDKYKSGMKASEKQILKAIEDGLKGVEPIDVLESTFNGMNDRKLNALIRETQANLYAAETSAVRYAEDAYRKIIFDSEIYLGTSAGTLDQAIDMATKDFLLKGINCIEYRNGARVDIRSYSEMAIRTAEKRSYMQGEAKMRDEYEMGLVIVTRRGNACPKCMQFTGRVFNDDVYGSIKPDPKYPLLSEAIAGGLYHPNCRDVHTTYFEGITTLRPEPTAAEKAEAERVYGLEQLQRYNERQIRKYKRLAAGTLNEDQKNEYIGKVKQWQKKQRDLINNNDELRRKYNREKIVTLPTGPISATPAPKKLKPNSEFNATITLKNFKDDVKIETEAELNRLFNKYDKNILAEPLTVTTYKRKGGTMAFYKSDVFDLSHTNELKYNTNHFGLEKEEIIKGAKEEIKKKWLIKVDDENLLNAVTDHEFGHYIERQMAKQAALKGEITILTEIKSGNGGKNTWAIDDFYKDIRKKIIKYYEDETGKIFDKSTLMSKYGNSDPAEFFAEAFASYELDSNSPFKNAMEKVLKEYNML